ncbi:MAG: rubrerythrin family protein, partial [Muribaculaceae bacterium]|nr:rubrerythrin family protein [Muribaculaceae bacterium]
MADTKSIKGTKTETNLANAYVSESTAYTRYTYFSQSAEKEGYYQYAKIFQETADNELHHAKIFLKLLTEGAVMTTPISVDPGILTPTVDNLKVAAQEEQSEGVDQYIHSAEVAEEEGFPEIAETFRAIATIENHHKERFDLLRKEIEDGTVWKREKPIKWQCQVCGYIFEGVE